MTYTKPEINTLGNASTVIQNGTKQEPFQPDDLGSVGVIQPAYDLDE